jgi:serine/threonine-protein kinase
LVQEWIDGVTLTAKVQQEGNVSKSSVKEILIGILTEKFQSSFYY